MSTSILYIKPEEIDSVEKRRKYTVSIIGCGRNGVLHACPFAEAGFRIICVDADRAVVNRLTRGKSPFLESRVETLLKKHVKNGCIKATNDVEAAVAQSDVILVTTQAKIDRKKKVNYSDIERVCKQVGSSLRRGSLVIVMSAVGPATADALIRETLENTSGFKVGVDFGLAYSPVRILDQQNSEKLVDCKRIVAATDKDSLNAASIVLRTITKEEVVRTDDVKTAEAAALFEAVQHSTNVALANEFACFCEKAGIDYYKAKELAEKSAHGTLVSPTLTCGNIREEPHLLLEEAENLNMKLRIPSIAREINEEILKHAVSLIRETLRGCGKTLRRAKISLLGISQTPNMKDSPKVSAEKLARILETKGAKVSLYDPYLSVKDLADLSHHVKKKFAEATEGVDCIVILTGHDRFKRLNLKKLKIMAKMPAAIVDLEGVVDPEKVEMEGFIYRGLGRGVWTK
jgi:UDP-N-acetyl-D-mannosaminuronic acid dehydrogenase